jgi:hypothetical protein
MDAITADALPVDKAKNGRPTQYDEKLGAQIVDAMRAGFTLERAAEYIGLHPGTVQGWTTKRAEFGRLVKKARREHEMSLLRSVELAGEKSWQARAWILERTHGYAQPSARLQVAQDVTHNIGGNLAQLLAGIRGRKQEKKAEVIDLKESKYNTYSATNEGKHIDITSTSDLIAKPIIPTHKQTLLKSRHKRMRLRKPRAESLAKYPTTTPPLPPPAAV